MRYLNLLLLAAIFLAAPGCAHKDTKGGDLRSAGTQLEDDTIESKSKIRIEEKYQDSVLVTVTSINRFVLITGEAPNEAAKTEIERIVRSIPNVKRTSNEITVGALSSSSSRRADAGITRNIKSGLGSSKTIRNKTVHIATHKGVVYLLGLVTHAEAAAAAEIASSVAGVQKVVRVFEYID